MNIGGSNRAANGNGGAEAHESFFRFLLPFRAAETFGGDGVPFHSFADAFGFFFDRADFPGDHAVASALKKFGKFRECVRAVLGLADAGLDLPPICHGKEL